MVGKALSLAATVLAASLHAHVVEIAAAADFDVRDFGAKGDGVAKDTAAIQNAVDKAFEAGGGRVVIASGTYLTGTVWLRSGVELHLEKGATVKGSTDRADYNANDAFPENFWCAGEEWSGGHLIVGYKVENVAITGEGVIDGNGPSFFGVCEEDSRFPGYKYGLKLHPKDRVWFRPGHMVAFFLSKNIRLSDVTLSNTPAWTTHFRCCDGLYIRNVTIDADRTIANSDGFSIDCTRNVAVEGCTIRTGDDGFAIRASCTQPGHAEGHPCENIHIRNCDVWSCCYGIRFGIGAGTVRNVTVEDCRFHESNGGIGFTPAWIPGKKGVYIENVRVSRCDVKECARPVEGNAKADDWRIRDIVFEGCRFESLLPIMLGGSKSQRPENVTFRNCSRRHLEKLRVRHHRKWGGVRSKKFMEGIGGVDNLRVERCLPPDEMKGALLLSFDGRDFGDWLNLMPLFEKYGVHATFFVSGAIDDDAVRTMKTLSEAGHSVGLCGFKNVNADEAIVAMGAERYFKEEIEPQTEPCRVAYIPARTFAYPNFRRMDETDSLFKKWGFARLRGGACGINSGCFPVSELKTRFRMDTVIAEEACNTDVEDILKCVRRCAERNEVLVLAMKTGWLERILATAQECGLAVIGFDEIQ